MRFTRVVYTVAAVYGLLVLAPLYFLLDVIGRETPPAVTHPEFYYGFVGLAILWQLVFLLIARDPVRYRALIPITILEKLVYAVPGLLLYAHGRLDAKLLPGPIMDGVLGFFFVLAYLQMRRVGTQRAQEIAARASASLS